MTVSTTHGIDFAAPTAQAPRPTPPKCSGLTHGATYPCHQYATWSVTYAAQTVMQGGGEGHRRYSCGQHLSQVCSAATEGHGVESAQVRPLI